MMKLSATALFCLILNIFIPGINHSTLNTTQYPFDVEVSGQGNKNIIFIPGFASSGKVWDDTKEKFTRNYKCYTLTMAGFAGTTPQRDPTFKAWETAIARYIKDHNITRPTVIGHSMGGAMALALASDYPELIEKIVVVDALPCLAAMSNPAFQSQEKPDCSAMVGQMTGMSNEQFSQMQKMTMRGLTTDTTKYQVLLDWSMTSDRTTLGKMFCDFMNTDLRAKLTSIKCPSLILLQPYFKNVSTAIDTQYSNLKTASVQYANKGLHFIMYDDKQWYLDQLDNFIAAK